MAQIYPALLMLCNQEKEIAKFIKLENLKMKRGTLGSEDYAAEVNIYSIF